MKFSTLLLTFCFLLSTTASLQAGRIAIEVDRYLPDHRSPTPVTFGVPFGRGDLAVDAPVAIVNQDGVSVAVQTAVAATWDKAGKQGVRWLHVDFQPHADQQYTLVYGRDLPTDAKPASAPIAVDQDSRIYINNGFFKGGIRKSGFDLFTGLSIDGHPLVRLKKNDAFSGFYMEHEKHGILRADLFKDSTVKLESTGPLRATIKAEGWYANEAGERFGRYIIRATFFKNKSDIKLEHTWIYTGLSTEDFVTDIGIQLNVIPESYGAGYMHWGTEPVEEGTTYNGVSRQETPNAAIIQDAPKRDLIQYRMIDLKTGNETFTGGKAGGWFVLYARPHTLTGVIRDAWQQYPYEFELDDSLVRIHLWPKHGKKLDLTWDGYWHQLTEEQKRYLANEKYHREEKLEDWIQRLRNRTNATGAAKTHEVWLNFATMRSVDLQSEPVGEALAREVAYPVIARSDPSHNAATRALDFCLHVPTDDPRFEVEQRYQRALLNMMQSAVTQNNWYGWWDWGGYHQHLFGVENGKRHLNAGLGRWHRARPKSHYGWGMFPWINVYRGGDRDWLRYAETYTTYSSDRVLCHHTDHGRIEGAEYHYDNSEVHWMGGYIRSPGGDIPSSNLQQKDDYVYMWWLTGNRRTLDRLEMWGEQISQHETFLNGYQQVTHGNENRNSGMLLHRYCMLYQATWDEKYLDQARQIANAFAKIDTVESVREVEKSGENLWHGSSGWAYEGLWLYWNLTGDERIRRTLNAYCERAINYNAGLVLAEEFSVSNAFTYGYELTKDPVYLNIGKALIDRLVAQWITEHSFSPSVKGTNVTSSRLMGRLAHAPNDWQAMYLPADSGKRFLDFRYIQRHGSPTMLPATVCFNETQDKAWSFEGVFTFGGDVVVYAPDGSIAARKEFDRLDNMRHTFEIPKDGQKGTYTLKCLSYETELDRQIHHSIDAWATVIRSDLPSVAILENKGENLAVRGRKYFFNVPAGTANGVLKILPMAGKRRTVWISQLDGSWQWRSDKHVTLIDGSYRVAIPTSSRDTKYVIEYDSPSDKYFPFNEGGQNFIRFEDISPIVAANPEDMFTPAVPDTLEQPKAAAATKTIDELFEMP